MMDDVKINNFAKVDKGGKELLIQSKGCQIWHTKKQVYKKAFDK